MLKQIASFYFFLVGKDMKNMYKQNNVYLPHKLVLLV